MTALVSDMWTYVDRDSDADRWAIANYGHGGTSITFWQRIAEGKRRG